MIHVALLGSSRKLSSSQLKLKAQRLTFSFKTGNVVFRTEFDRNRTSLS